LHLTNVFLGKEYAFGYFKDKLAVLPAQPLL